MKKLHNPLEFRTSVVIFKHYRKLILLPLKEILAAAVMPMPM